MVDTVLNAPVATTSYKSVTTTKLPQIKMCQTSIFFLIVRKGSKLQNVANVYFKVNAQVRLNRGRVGKNFLLKFY